jgi:3',5'-cyclic AMP phosphodiesterase CpdA
MLCPWAEPKYHNMSTKHLLISLTALYLLAPFGQAQVNEPDHLMVCLLADPQLIMVPETPLYVDYAMTDLSGLKHDFIAVLGDLAQNSAHFYKDYKEAVLDKTEKPLFSLAGNGDVGAGLEAYKEATGLPLYYSFYRKGIRFIFLSTVRFTGEFNHICHLGPEQLNWLRQELKSDTLSTSILFSHPPIFETTFHSEERDHLKAPGSMYLSESLEVRELLRLHPNVKIFAHGHLHYTYGSKDDFNRGGYFSEGNLLHVSVGGTANNKGSSFLFIEKGKITIRVRDHEHKTWKDEFEYQVDVQTTITESIHENPDSAWAIIKKQIQNN